MAAWLTVESPVPEDLPSGPTSGTPTAAAAAASGSSCVTPALGRHFDPIGPTDRLPRCPTPAFCRPVPRTSLHLRGSPRSGPKHAPC